MRTLLTVAVVILISCCRANAGDEADDLVRVPVLDGVYTVEAPGDWHLEVSGDDFTATFSEAPGADGTLVIAPPNPVVDDVREYTNMSIQGLFKAFGNGEIMEENDRNIGKFAAYTAMFGFKVEDNPFMGWARTVDLDGFAVQTIAIVSAKKYVAFMQKAGDIADSFELDVDEAEAFLPELKRVGRKAYDDLEKNLMQKGGIPKPAEAKDDKTKKEDK